MSSEQGFRSVVALRATIPSEGFTAGTLGTERSGSGVVINDRGLVLTIGYLITEAEDIWLTDVDGRITRGHALAYDQESGLGLVQALGRLAVPAIELGSAAEAEAGDQVTLVAGARDQLVRGVIVGKQEFAGYWEYLLDEAIFTAPAHPLWGGAGLIDARGRLIGIGSLLVQQVTEHGERQDANMIVPIDLLPPILDDLLSFGRVNKPARPWLGLFSAESDDEVVVTELAENGPAAEAGIRQGDVIARVSDRDVENLADFYRKVWSSGPAGTDIPLGIRRDGRRLEVRIRSADRNSFLKKPSLQ